MPTNLLCYRDPNFDINSFDYNFESTAQSIISNDYEFDPVSVIPNENSVAYNSCASGFNLENVAPIIPTAISIERVVINNVADPRNILPRSVFNLLAMNLQNILGGYNRALYFPYEYMNTDAVGSENQRLISDYMTRSIVGWIYLPICEPCRTRYFGNCNIYDCERHDSSLISRYDLDSCADCGNFICSTAIVYSSSPSDYCSYECDECSNLICTSCYDAHRGECNTYCDNCDSYVRDGDSHEYDSCYDDGDRPFNERFIHDYGYKPTFVKRFTTDDIMFLNPLNMKITTKKFEKSLKKQTNHPLKFSADTEEIGLYSPEKHHITTDGSTSVSVALGDRRWNRKGNLIKPTTDHLLFMGFELETMLSSSGNRSSESELNKFVRDVNKESSVYLASDSTVSGYEITTHPMTLDYIKKEFPLKTLLDSARTDGHRSGIDAGLHVHVGNTGLGLTDNDKMNTRLNLTALMDINWEYMCVLANRETSWARKMIMVDNIHTIDSKLKLVSLINSAIEYQFKNPKYWAINFSSNNVQNLNTTEFRLFKSTLNYNCIIARLELVSLLCDIAVQNDLQTCCSLEWSDIVNHAKKLGYKKLINYMATKRVSRGLKAVEDTGSKVPLVYRS